MAENMLLDPESTLAAAKAIARPAPTLEPATDLPNEIKNFYKTLDDTQIGALTALSGEDISLLEELADLITSRIEQYRRLLN